MATTARPSYLELAARIEAEERATWPKGAVECSTCRGFRQITIGFIDGTPQHRDCPACYFGYEMTPEIEQAQIDADKAAFEATQPDYDQHARARVAAGLEPW